MIQMYSFAMSIPKGDISHGISKIPDRTIRIERMITSVTKENIAIITGIYIASSNQLIAPIDAYLFSATLLKISRDEFLKKHGLSQATYQQIDDYLEEHEMSMPDPCRAELGTISPMCDMRITGTFNEECRLMFTGLAVQ